MIGIEAPFCPTPIPNGTSSPPQYALFPTSRTGLLFSSTSASVGLSLPVPGSIEFPLPIFRPFARNHRGSGLHFHASGTPRQASQWIITSSGPVRLSLERTKVFTLAYVQVQGEFRLGDMMLFTWIARVMKLTTKLLKTFTCI